MSTIKEATKYIVRIKDSDYIESHYNFEQAARAAKLIQSNSPNTTIIIQEVTTWVISPK